MPLATGHGKLIAVRFVTVGVPSAVGGGDEGGDGAGEGVTTGLGVASRRTRNGTQTFTTNGSSPAQGGPVSPHMRWSPRPPASEGTGEPKRNPPRESARGPGVLRNGFGESK